MAVSTEPWTPASTPGCNWSERGAVIPSAPAASLWPPPSTLPPTSPLAPVPREMSQPRLLSIIPRPLFGAEERAGIFWSALWQLLAIFKSWSHTPLLWDWEPPVCFIFFNLSIVPVLCDSSSFSHLFPLFSIWISSVCLSYLIYLEGKCHRLEMKGSVTFKSMDSGIHVNPWLIHVYVWQKPLQYCKVVSLQLIKVKGKKKNNGKQKNKKVEAKKKKRVWTLMPLWGCVALGKLINLSVSQFFHPWNKDE